VQDEAKVALINMTETTMEGSAIVVTIYGHKQLMTMDEFATMSIVEFAKLFTASLHNLDVLGVLAVHLQYSLCHAKESCSCCDSKVPLCSTTLAATNKTP